MSDPLSCSERGGVVSRPLTVVLRSELISTREEALAYYASRVAGRRVLTCYGKPIAIVFEAEGTHFFSEEAKDGQAIEGADRIQRRVPGGRVEVRRFSIDRARLLDQIIPAIERFTVSIPGTGPGGREKRMLQGPAMKDGRYVRVVLRPGPGDAYTAVTAYPITIEKWRECVRARRAKFPP
jgi:hypothetical protein